MTDSTLTKYEPATLPDAERLADRLARSGLIPEALRGKPGDVLIVLMTGHELGLAPMQALRGLHVVNGRPIMAADLAVALVKRSPACGHFSLLESTDARATYETQRRGEPGKTRLTWTIEQADAAGLLNRGPWKQTPAAMLRARCALALARAVYPDLLMGIYDPDEIADAQPVRVVGASSTSAGPGPAELNQTAPPAPALEHDLATTYRAPPATDLRQNATPPPAAPPPEDAQIVEPPAPAEITEASLLADIAAAPGRTSLRAVVGAKIKASGLGQVPAIRDAYAARLAELGKG